MLPLPEQRYRIPGTRGADWSVPERVPLTHTGWLPESPVSAWFQACHDEQALYISMEAEEDDIRATLRGPLEQVCNDSCLEFFFAPDSRDERYFNFEFNPLGTLYLGFGAGRPTRVRQIPQNPEPFQIRTWREDRTWGVSFAVPASFVRLYFPEFRLSGESCGNFYKCGDQTSVPHYLAWAPLSCSSPDFHRRWDFGRLVFD